MIKTKEHFNPSRNSQFNVKIGIEKLFLILIVKRLKKETSRAESGRNNQTREKILKIITNTLTKVEEKMRESQQKNQDTKSIGKKK